MPPQPPVLGSIFPPEPEYRREHLTEEQRERERQWQRKEQEASEKERQEQANPRAAALERNRKLATSEVD